MGIQCVVFVDKGSTGEPFLFEALPREGENIKITRRGEATTLSVENIIHVADAAHDAQPAPHVEIHASTRSLGN